MTSLSARWMCIPGLPDKSKWNPLSCCQAYFELTIPARRSTALSATPASSRCLILKMIHLNDGLQTQVKINNDSCLQRISNKTVAEILELPAVLRVQFLHRLRVGGEFRTRSSILVDVHLPDNDVIKIEDSSSAPPPPPPVDTQKIKTADSMKHPPTANKNLQLKKPKSE
ncbi:hypothetical protein R1flu_028776 [Riccia fluitans]|uniref:Ubiquitin-like domain-containing protein n=1 Tax=Riccia fluitans TaxID=41844 RepID=A0ABD1XNA7_9MARC